MKKVILVVNPGKDGLEIEVLNASREQIQKFETAFINAGKMVRLESAPGDKDLLVVTERDLSELQAFAKAAFFDANTELHMFVNADGQGNFSQYVLTPDSGSAIECMACKAAANLKATVDKNLSTLDKLLTALGRDRGGCIITGSIALYVQDFKFDIENDIHDVDILMPYDPELQARLSLLARNSEPELNPHGLYPDGKSADGTTRIDFVFQGVRFNVWLTPEYDTRAFMYKDYFKYASIRSILEYKMSYNRGKDWDYFMKTFQALYSNIAR